MNEGDDIGGYTLLHRLGAGGAGTVWLAEDGGGARVALKLVHPALAASEAARERLAREARTVNSVRSDAVAHVLDIETDATQPFVVSQYIEGPTLASILQRGPLPLPVVTALAAHMARTIDAVHDAHIIHRDIKPSNIICSNEGPILIDFGIAQGDGDERLTQTGLVSGTAGYTAPELLRAQDASNATDWWAWCATLLTAATGRPPYGTGDIQGVIMRVLNGQPDVRGLAPAVAGALEAALSPDPAARPDPADLVGELHAAYGLPGGVDSIDDVAWEGIYDTLPATDVLPTADARVDGAPLARTRALPSSDATAALTAPGAVAAPAWQGGADLAAAEPRVDAGFAPPPAPLAQPPLQSPAPQVPLPPASAPFNGWEAPAAPPPESVWAAIGQPAYAPRLPATAWFVGLFFMMPLAMLPLTMGMAGSVIVLAILLLISIVGSCLRYREMRRFRAQGQRASDTAWMIALSPLLAIRSAAALVWGIAVGAIIPYAVWLLYTLNTTGWADWQRIWSILTSSSVTIGVDPLITDRIGSAALWLVVWASLALNWLMPTSVDLRDGVSRGAAVILGPRWIRVLACVFAVGVVGATWLILTGAGL